MGIRKSRFMEHLKLVAHIEHSTAVMHFGMIGYDLTMQPFQGVESYNFVVNDVFSLGRNAVSNNVLHENFSRNTSRVEWG